MTTRRTCGDCQLCCRLLPTSEIDKPALRRCPHQKHGVGCAIYARRPLSCQLWSCRWLVNDDTAELPRPDRSHYVIDIMPDFIVATEPGSDPVQVPVLQVWIDPAHRDAHRAPSFRRWLARQNVPALIRCGNRDGFVLVPPGRTGGRGWLEQGATSTGREHTLQEKVAAVGGALRMEFVRDDGVGRAVIEVDGRTIETAFHGASE